jgi:hypothetical protein
VPASRSSTARDPASYRDPAGFAFERDGVPYRQIDDSFAPDWDHLIESGLYGRLVDAGLLIAEEEADVALAAEPLAYRVIAPERIDFISYPYEWSFSQLKDAALLTLRAQAMASKEGMTLRDASAYNAQFRAGRPLLIDSLSFERAVPGRPWTAHRSTSRPCSARWMTTVSGPVCATPSPLISWSGIADAYEVKFEDVVAGFVSAHRGSRRPAEVLPDHRPMHL